MNDSDSIKSWLRNWVFLVFIVGAVIMNLKISGEQQFSYLAQSFLSGKTYFLELPGTWEDVVWWEGRYYWPLSPVPALLIAPLVLLLDKGELFRLGSVQAIMTAVLLGVGYFLARKKGFSRDEGLWLCFALVFASVYQMVAFVSWGWYFVQAITAAVTMLALFEWQGRRRYGVIGMLMGLVFATRVTAGMSVIFFTLAVLSEKAGRREKFKNLIKLSLPIAIWAVVLFGYNFVRFGDGWNNGYILTNNLASEKDRYELLNHGLFKLSNIPTNFYYYFLKTLDPVRIEKEAMFGQTNILKWPYVTINFPGTSFFVVSPIFLFMFRAKWEGVVKWAGVTTFITLVVILSYYWSGWTQVGPRYMIDVLPLMFVILINGIRRKWLNWKMKAVILGSACLNFYFYLRVFFSWE